MDIALPFMFRLSFLQPGQSYALKSLTPIEKTMIKDLHAFGILYKPPEIGDKKARSYYPTPLSENLSSSTLSASERSTTGFIIVETTFKVYAYTSSPLHVALLSLFTEILIRLPNLVIGVIKKQSIYRAFKRNINTNLIVSYLAQYAHPRQTEGKVGGGINGGVPSTVSDQIQFWERERNRYQLEKGSLFCDFNNSQEFQTVLLFVKKKKKLLYSQAPSQGSGAGGFVGSKPLTDAELAELRLAMTHRS